MIPSGVKKYNIYLQNEVDLKYKVTKMEIFKY